jgi:hypothetical protein
MIFFLIHSLAGAGLLLNGTFFFFWLDEFEWSFWFLPSRGGWNCAYAQPVKRSGWCNGCGTSLQGWCFLERVSFLETRLSPLAQLDRN